MQIIDKGTGPPIVIVPGVQGRWEWMSPGVDALARHCRVITFTLQDVPREATERPARPALHDYVAQVERVMDRAGVDRAVICGVSYGGLIAAVFAARRRERTAGLVLVSALAPTWRPDIRARFFLRAPRALLPVFMIVSLRLYWEIKVASGGVLASIPASVRHAANVLAHMFSPVQVARRVALLDAGDLGRELARLNVPTLVVTGEDGLDLVVAPRITRQYLEMWPHAQSARIPRTGHLGLITRPDEFAGIVCPFVEAAVAGSEERRRIG